MALFKFLYKRGDQRISVDLPARVVDSPNTTIKKIKVFDASSKGVRLALDSNVTPFKTLDLEVEIACGQFLRMQVEFRWKSSVNTNEYGCRILSMSDEKTWSVFIAQNFSNNKGWKQALFGKVS